MKLSILSSLQQDIEDLKGLTNYEKDGLTEEVMKKQARAILLNIEDHFDELLKSENG